MRKKLLSLLLAALMILGLLPGAVLAAEGDASPAAPAAEEEVIPAPAEENAPVTQAAEEDAAPAVQAAEDVAVQADEETVAPPIVKVDGTAYDVTYVGVANSYGDQLYKVTVPSGTESVTLFWQAAADAGDALVCCPCHLIDNLTANTGTATFPLTGHGENEEAGAVSAEYCTEEQLASLKADGRSLSFAQFIYYANGDVAGCAVIAIEVEADDSSDSNAITVTVDGTAYEVKDTGTVTADSKAAPIYKVVVPNGTAAVTGHWGMLVTRGSVACLCGACTVSLSELKASNGTFTLPLTGHSGEEAAAVSKGYFATAEALQNIKDQSYQKMMFAWMRCRDADGNWCYALLCVEIEGVTNTAPALASGVTLYTVVAPDGETYTTDVTKFFTDEDAGDTLTYYVSVNGGEFEKLEKPEAYTYTYGENFVNVRLTFKANDGKADSLQNCTVILNNPEYPVVKGADSSTTDTTTGTPVRLSIGSLITSPKSYGLYYFVSIDGGEYKQVTLSSNKYTYAPTKAGTHTLLFKASTAKTLDEGKTSGVYTWTVTATGADIDNHAPVVKNPTEGPGQLGTTYGVMYWKPDLANIFSDPDGDTLTYSYSIDGSDFSEYYPTVGIHADYLKPDGTHTVTIRATDPYGEYAEFTVTIEKSTNHLPTKKADAPDKLSVFVPVGLTYTVDANLYYEDVDAKDQGKLRFLNNRYQSAGSYTASTVGDTKTETAYGADSVDRSVDGIEITYTAIGIDKEDTATTGVAYTIDPAALDGINIPGNYKVRVSKGTTGGAEQSFDGTFTVTPEEAAVYTIHIYGDKSAATADNYVVQLTVEKPNTPPTLAEGVAASVKASAYEGIPWELDLSTIFYDADGDDLTYKVSVNDGEFEAADAKYSYTPATTENSVKLIFKANDGKVESSDTYIVKLDVKHTPTRLVESGSGSAAAGAYANVYLDNVFQDDASIFTDLNYYVSIDGGEEFFFLRSAKRGAQFSRAFETVGEHTLKFRAALGPLFSDVYTYTLTVTGESVTNYKPYILDTARDEERTEPMWTGGGSYYTNWRPDLSKVFGDDLKDTGDNGEQSRLTFTFKDDKDPDFRTYYPNTGYATGASKSSVGERTVTFRATDPYGEYVEWVTHVTVMEDHKATRKEGVQEAYTFDVPFGATITLNAEDYFEDNDSKDIENGVLFCNAVSHATYKPYTYVANDSNDYVIRMVGYSGNDWGTQSVTFTFHTVMPTSWPTITDLSAATLSGVGNDTTGAGEGKVNVKSVTVTQYDSLRVENNKASAGLILIRMDEDVDTLERPYYELSGMTADAVVSTGAAIGAELTDDIKLYAADNYRLAQAVSVSQNIENETYGDYTLTTYYDFMLVGVNARPILAASTASVREKITLGDTWTLNLDGLFYDADGDPLTYKVSVNGAEAVTIEGSIYTLTPEDGVYTLVFTANDTKADSKETYTVTLVTKNPGAPDWPQILEYNLTQELEVTAGSNSTRYPEGTIPAVKVELVQYSELVVDGAKTYAGEILVYVAEDITAAGRRSYQIIKGSVEGKASNDATANLTSSITMRKTKSYVNNTTLNVKEDGKTYYYYVKLAQAEIPAFAPVIGNGTAAGTTENNVTTFPAGSGSGAPTVTVTAPASGWAVGENTFTVACDKACVVLVKSGDTYTKLTASDADGAHSFTATLAEGDEIIVRLKGDVNGDGMISAADFGQAKAAALGYLSLSGANLHCATVSGGTSVRAADFGQIKAVALGNLTFKW